MTTIQQLKLQEKKMKYVIFDNELARILRSFKTKKDCRGWLMEGLYACQGAERDHYVSMLQQLDCGKKTLCYWEN